MCGVPHGADLDEYFARSRFRFRDILLDERSAAA
jgi:hypothetical protein